MAITLNYNLGDNISKMLNELQEKLQHRNKNLTLDKCVHFTYQKIIIQGEKNGNSK